MRITLVFLLCCIAAALASPTSELLDTLMGEIMDEGFAGNNFIENTDDERREVINQQQMQIPGGLYEPQQRSGGLYEPQQRSGGLYEPQQRSGGGNEPGQVPGGGGRRPGGGRQGGLGQRPGGRNEPQQRSGGLYEPQQRSGRRNQRPRLRFRPMPKPRQRPIEDTESSRSGSSRSGSSRSGSSRSGSRSSGSKIAYERYIPQRPFDVQQRSGGLNEPQQRSRGLNEPQHRRGGLNRRPRPRPMPKPRQRPIEDTEGSRLRSSGSESSHSGSRSSDNELRYIYT